MYLVYMHEVKSYYIYRNLPQLPLLEFVILKSKNNRILYKK